MKIDILGPLKTFFKDNFFLFPSGELFIERNAIHTSRELSTAFNPLKPWPGWLFRMSKAGSVVPFALQEAQLGA